MTTVIVLQRSSGEKTTAGTALPKPENSPRNSLPRTIRKTGEAVRTISGQPVFLHTSAHVHLHPETPAKTR